MLTLTFQTDREVQLLRSTIQRQIEQLDREADAKPGTAASLPRKQAQELRELLSRVELGPVQLRL